MGWVKRKLFGISDAETSFEKRGFGPGTPQAQERLERIGAAFLFGYHHALDEADPSLLAERLSAMEPERVGFAFEGAAMSLALLDLLVPWGGGRVKALLAGAGDAHIYMVHIGMGWALARLKRRVEKPLERFDPLMRWLALDGYGFHEGFFHWKDYVENGATPTRLSGYALRAFDQGLGRSLWFVAAADVERVKRMIGGLNPTRHADLWSGIGLAATYAGGVDEATLLALKQAAHRFAPQLAQGSAFAAKARQRAGNPAPHTELACRLLAGRPAVAAAAVIDSALSNLPPDGELPAYEGWRSRIHSEFSQAVNP
jgi:enediyne biosynthesis protein E3